MEGKTPDFGSNVGFNQFTKSYFQSISVLHHKPVSLLWREAEPMHQQVLSAVQAT